MKYKTAVNDSYLKNGQYCCDEREEDDRLDVAGVVYVQVGVGEGGGGGEDQRQHQDVAGGRGHPPQHAVRLQLPAGQSRRKYMNMQIVHISNH